MHSASWHVKCYYIDRTQQQTTLNEVNAMKKIMNWLDKMMIAITFAECNDMNSAKQTLGSIKETVEEPVASPKSSPLSRLINMIKALEDSMAATAFSEAGDQVSAFKLYHHGKNARKKILLGTDHQTLDLQTIGYALRLCQRVEAGLEILHVVDSGTSHKNMSNGNEVYASPRQLQSLLGEMGIEYTPVTAQESFQKELLDHVSKRTNIMCVVVGPNTGEREKTSGNKKMKALAKAFSALNCPLVVYNQPAPA